jgi:uncharacterized protein (DUF2252 family)
MTATLFDTGKRDRATLAAFGRGLRNWISRRSHGDWTPALDRPDPVAILKRQEPGRLGELIPIRYGRMLASPFRFFCGAAAVMAWDLSLTPTTGVHVQACGDAHALNFGGYASPERQLVFDINDFDETLPAPWEFDVKRLAASLVLEGRDAGRGDRVGKEAVETMVAAYCDTLATLANATTLQIHYASASADELLAAAGSKTVTRAIERYTEQAVKRTHLTAFKKWVRADDHGQRFIEDPPLLVRLSGEETEHLHQIYNTYREGLPEHRRHVLRQYRFRDAARKVVGVGSVGLRAYVILLAGQGQPDPLILQVKEATSSVLTPYIGRSGCACERSVSRLRTPRRSRLLHAPAARHERPNRRDGEHRPAQPRRRPLRRNPGSRPRPIRRSQRHLGLSRSGPTLRRGAVGLCGRLCGSDRARFRTPRGCPRQR